MKEKQLSTDTIETVLLKFDDTIYNSYILKNPTFVPNFDESELEITVEKK